MRPLRIGVQLPEVEYTASWADHVEMARTAERIGLDSIWLGDHLLYRWPGRPAKGPWECWSMLAALAAVTERVRLGPLVAATSFHAPALLAKKAATIDEISGGRLVLGLGAGWNEAEYRAFGFPFDDRVSRFEEAFTIIRQLLREGRSDFHGRYYSVDDCQLIPRGPRPKGPPLMVGSVGERMLAITMPFVDEWNAWFAWFDNKPEGIVPLRQKVDAACVAAGRDPSEVRRTAAVLVALPGEVGRNQGDPEDDAYEPIRGGPEQIAAQLAAFADVGIDELQLVLDPITPASIEALAPVLAALEAGSGP